MKKSFYSPSRNKASILHLIKEAYLFWLNIVPHMPHGSRYTIGNRIEDKFLNLLDLSYTAYFAKKEGKSEKIADCIFATDQLRFLISVAWEGKLISNKHFENIALKLDEVGRSLGAWKKSLDSPQKKNPTTT